ncbi:MAG: hypothetical protein HZA31_11675 [Opitutae bacterium]|nr:hypothetical protein [Opitutae bacterium]
MDRYTQSRQAADASPAARPSRRTALFIATAVLAALPAIGRAETADAELLSEIERRAVLYFVEQTHPVTGLTRDRAPTTGETGSQQASVAANGFALTAWGIAVHNGWMTPAEGRQRALTTLRTMHRQTERVRGWFYHFIDVETGRRTWQCEASTIDTALFLQGAVFAREFFHDAEITRLVDDIYRQIDWRWALNGGATLSHGWTPERGFITYRWDRYSEMMGLYLLGIGAPTRPLPATAWHAWKRGPTLAYAGRTFLHCPPLFTHQYSHAWFDFRERRDRYGDYWANSVDATLAQRQWCADQAERFPLWSLQLWGLSASDSVRGYEAWGGPQDSGKHDGTLVPCAPGGSLPFAPRECLAALQAMRTAGGDALWGRYGFADAFNPHTGWVASDVIAIDQGIMLLMAENLRSNLVWDVFQRAPEVQRAMRLAGFKEQPAFRSGSLLLATLR